MAESGRHRRPQPVSYGDVSLFLLNQRYQAVADSQDVVDGTENSSPVKVVTHSMATANVLRFVKVAILPFIFALTTQMPSFYRYETKRVDD